MPNNALQRTGSHRGRPVLAKGWRARRGGMGTVPAAELGRWAATRSVIAIEPAALEHLCPPKVVEILRQLHDDGWYIVTMRGSHRQLRHPTKPGRVTVHGKPSDSIAPGTLNSILKQSGLKK